jgi:hypothetical protein
MPKLSPADFIVSNITKQMHVNTGQTSAKAVPEYVINVIMENDPQEIKVATIEFAYHIINHNIQRALYWLNWLLTWESLNIKKYKVYNSAVRSGSCFKSSMLIPIKKNRNAIWLIWYRSHYN